MLRFIRILLYSLILSIVLPGSVEAEGRSLPLVINEFMASNNSSGRDPQGTQIGIPTHRTGKCVDRVLTESRGEFGTE